MVAEIFLTRLENYINKSGYVIFCTPKSPCNLAYVCHSKHPITSLQKEIMWKSTYY